MAEQRLAYLRAPMGGSVLAPGDGYRVGFGFGHHLLLPDGITTESNYYEADLAQFMAPRPDMPQPPYPGVSVTVTLHDDRPGGWPPGCYEFVLTCLPNYPLCTATYDIRLCPTDWYCPPCVEQGAGGGASGSSGFGGGGGGFGGRGGGRLGGATGALPPYDELGG